MQLTTYTLKMCLKIKIKTDRTVVYVGSQKNNRQVHKQNVVVQIGIEKKENIPSFQILVWYKNATFSYLSR